MSDDSAFRPADPAGIHELRRSYHDRIADVREQSVAMLRAVVLGIRVASGALTEGAPVEPATVPDVRRARAEAAYVDGTVVGMLALESPVARDLRLILAARDVAQLALLCVGLCAQLAVRVDRVVTGLDPARLRLVGEVGAGTEALLVEAESAWSALDPEMARAVLGHAGEAREMQAGLISELIGLTDVPVPLAFDLAMVARAFERLADHGLEVADRVLFAVPGG
ncbi:MAG TPA: hypothetical protein VKI19_01020 [Acidimicrobiales bacterium]|nr:hypothetical protein [Acidimicrobiales bacterium]